MEDEDEDEAATFLPRFGENYGEKLLTFIL